MFSVTTFSQKVKDVNIAAGIMAEKLNKNLTLTEEQKKHVHAEAEIYLKKLRSINRTDKSEIANVQRKEAWNKYQTALYTLLTNDQKSKIEEARAKHIEEARDRFNNK